MARVASEREVRRARAVAPIVARGRVADLAEARAGTGGAREASVGLAVEVGELDRRGTAVGLLDRPAEVRSDRTDEPALARGIVAALGDHVVRSGERQHGADQDQVRAPVRLVTDGALSHGRDAGIVVRDLLAVTIGAARPATVPALGEARLQVLVTELTFEVEAAVAAVRGHRGGEIAVAEGARPEGLLGRRRRTAELVGAMPAAGDHAGGESE